MFVVKYVTLNWTDTVLSFVIILVLVNWTVGITNLFILTVKIIVGVNVDAEYMTAPVIVFVIARALVQFEDVK